MEEEITCDKDELISQRLKELEDGAHVQFKYTYKPLPEDVLDSIQEKYLEKNNGKVTLKNLVDDVKKYICQHHEHAPVVIVSGKDVSVIDRLILIALCREGIETEFLETFKEFMEGGDE